MKASQNSHKSSNDRYKATLEPTGATLILKNGNTYRHYEVRLHDSGEHYNEVKSRRRAGIFEVQRQWRV